MTNLDNIRELHNCLIRLLKYRMYTEVSQILLTKIDFKNLSELKTALICTKSIDNEGVKMSRDYILKRYNNLKTKHP